jgi:AraC-like DNA-binding protein
MLLSIVASITEIFLMYSGYIIHCLYLVDFSETFTLLIGPCFYLLVVSVTQSKLKWKHYLHLAFPLIYFFLELPFLVLPEDAKYNAWVGSYHPDWARRPFDYEYDPRLFWVTDHATEIALISLALYTCLGLTEIFKAFKKRKESFWKPTNPSLQFLRWEVFLIASATLGILIVKLFHDHDTGDHLIATYITVNIYLTSFRIIQKSGFFKPVTLDEVPKYRTSTASPEDRQQLLSKLEKLMNEEKPFLKTEFSLPDLAQHLGTTVHVLSQAINEGLGKNFFEMVAEYRVNEAKKLLVDQPNIKVEEIAGQVGYNSKSSFNSMFKKLTGSTPSEFRLQSKQGREKI